ncbi:hypothetical protein V865_007987 [Kwoniella europaea PYCC6329]|uniref:3'-5' exonuclease domain-containing protein n=1 Tax=Kwoniella europaea PYCC6329 TaxID=1423913 RepID=A0AAX4KUM0_9TREE
MRTIPKSPKYDEEAETLLVPRLRLLGLSNDLDQDDDEPEGDADLLRIGQPSSLRHRFTTWEFSYKTYPQSGSPVELVYVESKSEADSQLSRLAGPIIGLDMEYVGTFMQHQRPVLLQFCDERLIVLVHLRDIDQDDTPIPSKAVEILCNTKIYKTGANIREDLILLLRSYPQQFHHDTSKSRLSGIALSEDIDHNHANGSKSVDIQGIPHHILELSFLARAVNPSRWENHGGPQIGLATLCEKYLSLELCKWHEGNWSGILTERQKDYAANDSYASLQICLKLQHLIEAKGIYLDLAESCTELRNRDIPSTVPVQRSTNNHTIDDLTSSSPVQGQI